MFASRNHHRRRALKFYASVRVDVRRIASIKDGDAVTGSPPRQKSSRNKVLRRSVKRIRHHVRRGISKEGDLLDLAVR